MKKIITLILCLCIFTSLFPAYAAPAWPTDYGLHGIERQFRPEDKYVSEQNPPTFSWSAVTGSTSYDLIICKDKELKEIAYSQYGIVDNIFGFNYIFEPGTYYWSVRYNKGNTPSEWCPARRFRIKKNAHELTFPPIDEMIAGIPETHPKIWLKDGLDNLRSHGETEAGKEYIERCKAYLDEQMKNPIEPEPKAENFSDSDSLYYTLRMDICARVEKQMSYAAFVYLMTGDKKYGEYGVDVTVSVAKWDPNGVTNYYSQDQVHRELAYVSAIAYDWLYELMTDEERETVREMIRVRTQIMADDLINSNVSLLERPYNSHGVTALGYIRYIATALLGEIPEAEEWLRFSLPVVNIGDPVWTYQDGGWSQGTYYYLPGGRYDLLEQTGVFPTSKKAWNQNEWMFGLYQYPAGSVGAFGDSSYSAQNAGMLVGYSRMASTLKNGYAKWALEELGDYTQVENYSDGNFPVATFLNIINGYHEVETKPPYDLPKGKRFRDIGWASMHSDLADQKRISLFFKSSPFGSFNHSHADQNSFVIQAFGERLAIDSGYYAYGTDWEHRYVRQTFAHNGITIDGGQGQTINDMTAKGYLKEFITTSDFDMVKGDASNAYGGYINKADRYIIYIRPDIFIVVDDLEAANKSGAKFEFWINGLQDTISVYDSKDGARVQKNKAVLDAKIHYPSKVTPKYSNIFSGADYVQVETTASYKNHEVQTRVWFETEKLKETKIVTTLDVHRESENPQNIKKETGDGYIKMSFENGAVAYIKTDNRETVEADNISFKGAAYVENGSAYMLISGTQLIKDGKLIHESDKPVSASLGRGILNISTWDDAVIKHYCKDIEKIVDNEGNELDRGIGVDYSYDNEYINLNADKGDYVFIINDSDIKPDINMESSVPVIFDGNTKYVAAHQIKDIDGSITFHGRLGNKEGMYKINSLSEGMNIKNADKGEIIYLEENMRFSSYGNENPYIDISTVTFPEYSATEIKDHESLKEACDIFIEAEDFKEITGVAHTYTTRAFLSGGAGVSQLDTPQDTATYEFEVEEDGYYDFCIKQVAWNYGTKRQFIIDDESGMFECAYTNGYGSVPEHWTSIKLSTRTYLTKGKHTLKIMGLNFNTNFDWFGFVKNEEVK